MTAGPAAPSRLLPSFPGPAWPLGAASLRPLVSLGARHCHWTLKAPSAARASLRDEVLSSSGLWKPGPSWGQRGAWVGPRILGRLTLGECLPSTAPHGCVLGEEGLASPGLEMRRTPALDGKTRDGFTQQGRCCAWEEKRPVGDGGRDRRVSGGLMARLPPPGPVQNPLCCGTTSRPDSGTSSQGTS